MIPEVTVDAELEFESMPSLTYSLSGGMIDGLEAIKQSIYCILQTERFEWAIYSWDYGIETYDLYGMDPDWVILEVERRISEALLQDDRIEAVTNFVFTQSNGKLHVTFLVETTEGEIEVEQDV